MTTKELTERVIIGICLSGQFKVKIEFRGKQYSCKSNNTLAYDRIRGGADIHSDRQIYGMYTLRQALQRLYDECKRVNGLM